MDQETKIAETLKQNIPQPVEHTTTPTPVVSDPVLTPVDYPLDELTQYKLHQHFGEDYKEADEKARQQLAYIYQEVSKHIGSTDYPFVVAKINDLKRMLGLNHASNTRYKLYQWLKLDQQRTRIEMEQNNVREAL